MMGFNLFTKEKTATTKPTDRRRRRAASQPSKETLPADYAAAPADVFDDDPLRRMLQQERYNVIIRESDKRRDHPAGPQTIAEAKNLLESRMALVPAGSVAISQTLSAQPGAVDDDTPVEPFLLDVHTVTNARYQKFVSAGGYDELEYWPEEIWPHLIELKDLTGQPGPRYWRNGRHDLRLTDHPVVGVSWYEAQAYALWIGQRLPTEAEWQMAASWHINSSADLMRRFPWGDAMDKRRCNVWSSRIGTTVPVSYYPEGAAPNQVLQLVGNVWEWTDSEYSITDDNGRPVLGEMPMHAIRGGAFDTYFDTQASSQFRTGQIALARTYNTGFRCAMNLAEAAWINGE